MALVFTTCFSFAKTVDLSPLFDQSGLVGRGYLDFWEEVSHGSCHSDGSSRFKTQC